MSDLVFLGFGTFLFILTAALREPQASLKERNMYEPVIGLGVAIVLGIYRDGSRLANGGAQPPRRRPIICPH